MKVFKFVSLFAAFSLMIVSTAFAGTWKQDEKGWWYQNDDGSYPVSCWQTIDQKEYCFNESGYLLVSTITPDGFIVDENGVKIGTAAGGALSAAGAAAAGAATVDQSAAAVPAGNSNTAVSSAQGTVSGQTSSYYWTPGGKSYHSTAGCRSLARSKTILSGTLEEAKQAGKHDPCNNCIR